MRLAVLFLANNYSHKVMRSKIIKKAHKRDDFKLTSHNFLLRIRLEREYDSHIKKWRDFRSQYLPSGAEVL